MIGKGFIHRVTIEHVALRASAYLPGAMAIIRSLMKTQVTPISRDDTSVSPNDTSVSPSSVNPTDDFFDSLDAEGINVSHYLDKLVRLDLLGRRLENLYVKGCGENIITLNLILMLAVVQGEGIDEKLVLAADGLYDLSDHIKTSVPAVIDMNQAEIDSELPGPLGHMSLDALIEAELKDYANEYISLGGDESQLDEE